MSYLIDNYFEQNDYNEIIVRSQFTYDNKRLFSRLYVFFKLLLLIFYAFTLSLCYKPNFFIIMIVFMFLATINSFCYEYAHFKRYGTIFLSLNEFYEWKKKQYPQSRIIFSIIELIIKIVFFVQTFPPQCKFENLCEIGISVYKIHILILFMLYIIACFFSICLLSSIQCYNNSEQNIVRLHQAISSPIQTPINEECCICLDKDNNISWSILHCGHKFHNLCISTWLRSNQTCPICRCNINNIS